MTADSPGWFGRNWKWFVPVGCVSLLLLAIAAGALLGYGALRLYQGSGVADPGQDALAAARAHPQVIGALGQPLELDFMRRGSVQVDDDRGQVDMHYSIRGPRGKGEVHVVGERRQGRWTYSLMQAWIDGQPAAIDLRPAQPAAPPVD